MGLDVTAYRGLTKVDALFNANGQPVDPTTREPIDDYFICHTNPDFPGREDSLEDGAVYSYTEAEHVFGRSYGGYGHWREALAELAGYPLTEYQASRVIAKHAHAAACWAGATGPFSELINFADNEGVFGPVTATKLARDFAYWDERAKAFGDDYFYQGFCEMRHGMEMAADSGALEFH